MGRKVRLVSKLKSLPTKEELYVRQVARVFEDKCERFGYDLTIESQFDDAVKRFSPDFKVERAIYLKYQPHYIKAATKESRTKVEPVVPAKSTPGKLDKDVPDTLSRKPTNL